MEIAKLLHESLHVLVERELPAPVILQIFAQAFYAMNALVFNALLDYPVRFIVLSSTSLFSLIFFL